VPPTPGRESGFSRREDPEVGITMVGPDEILHADSQGQLETGAAEQFTRRLKARSDGVTPMADAHARPHLRHVEDAAQAAQPGGPATAVVSQTRSIKSYISRITSLDPRRH
jgi:hypothetical protein